MMRYKRLVSNGRIIISSNSKILYHVLLGDIQGFRNYYYIATKRNARCYKVQIVLKKDLPKIISMINLENERFRRENN